MNLIQNIPVRYTRFIITGLTILAVGTIYLLFFSTPMHTWLDLNTQLNITKVRLIDMEKTLYRREQVKALCEKFEERILATGTDAEELGFLLKELESLTRIKKVEVKSIRPLPSQWVGNYRKFLVSMEVQGRVHNMLELLYSIDTSPKILTVESLRVQALRTGANLLSADILISRTSAGGRLKQLPE